jgi:hypothetical protein
VNDHPKRAGPRLRPFQRTLDAGELREEIRRAELALDARSSLPVIAKPPARFGVSVALNASDVND